MVVEKLAVPVDDDCSATAFRKASRRLTQLYDSALAPSGLRSTQFAILSHIHNAGDRALGVADLAESLVLDRSALGHNLRPLERDGLIELRLDARDGRRRRVVLTQKGRTVLTDAIPRWAQAQAHVDNVLGSEKAQSLRNDLLRLARDERLCRG